MSAWVRRLTITFMAIQILIVDDHSVVRQGLRMFLSLDPDLEIVGKARNGAEGLQAARTRSWPPG